MGKVRATQRGYYAGLIREPGDEFEMEGKAAWAEPLEGSTSEPPSGQQGGEGAPSQVEIPADWESQHHRSIIALAQRILPGEQRDLTKDQAVEAIKAEIEKRSKPAE